MTGDFLCGKLISGSNESTQYQIKSMESETVNIKGRRFEVEITSGKIVKGEFKFAMDVTDDQGNEVSDMDTKRLIASRLRESHREYIALARHAFQPGSAKRKMAQTLDAIMDGETFIPHDEE